MTPTLWAFLLRPIFNAVLFFVIVAPIAWLLYRAFPEGRLKVLLFRVRSGPHAAPRDKWVMTGAAIAGYAALLGWILFLGAGIR